MLALLSSLLLTAAPAEANDALRAAEAAERAAAAAQTAAEAASRAADAAQRIAAVGAGERAAAAPQAPAAPAAPPPAAWSGTVGAGLISLTGSASAITTNFAASFERTAPEWISAIKAFAAYGRSRAVGATAAETVALNGGLRLRQDRRFSPRYSGFLAVEAVTDHVKSVEARPAVEAGVGLLWLEALEGDFVKERLRTDLGLQYARELRFQYYPTPLNVPDVPIGGPKLGVNFRYGLDRNVIFSEDFEISYSILGTARVLALSTTKIAARLTEALSLGVAFAVNHDSVPAPSKRATDTALTVGLEVGL